MNIYLVGSTIRPIHNLPLRLTENLNLVMYRNKQKPRIICRYGRQCEALLFVRLFDI